MNDRLRLVPLLLALLTPPSLEAEIIDRIAALIDRQVITLSEVNQVVEIRLRAPRQGEDEGEYRRRVLDAMVAHTLRYRDVERFGAADVPADSIESRLREIIARFPSEEAFTDTLLRVELTLDEVRALIKRQLQVQAYVDERFAPMIFVSIEEIESYYRETWAPQRQERGLRVPPLAEVSEEIRRLVRADRLQDEIDRWTEQLRARANVDIFVYR
ncbi:MAG TPA: hypothetical protein VMS56_01465 [Thermoanaerobaculia bacterium]|nr:hypothetical protein [Thermoanaerobaculia bacterium]